MSANLYHDFDISRDFPVATVPFEESDAAQQRLVMEGVAPGRYILALEGANILSEARSVEMRLGADVDVGEVRLHFAQNEPVTAIEGIA